jgi:branched-chain amino acid transport system substrate-binding protein
MVAVVVVGVATSCNSGQGPAHEQEPVIVIASDLPLSGPDDAFVTPLRAAIDLAITDSGTIHGYPLAYEPLDDALAGRFNPFKGEQDAKTVVRDTRILGLVGPYNSGVAQFEIPITSAANLVMISPSNTLDCLTAASPCAPRAALPNNYFRIAATDSAQARAGASFAVGKLNQKRFAVLADSTDIGVLLAKAFDSSVTTAGGMVVYQQTYSELGNDFRPELREARAAGAESLFVAGIYDSACKIRAQMAGIFPAEAYLISGDRITDTACLSAAGASGNDHLLATVSSSQPSNTNKVFKEFLAHGIRPVTYSFEAYDSAQILIDAISRAIGLSGGGIPSRLQVLNAVAATRDFVGSSGTFTFLPSGDPVQPSVSLYRVENGAWTFWQNAT